MFKIGDVVKFFDRYGRPVTGRVIYDHGDNRYNVQNIRKIQWPYTLKGDQLIKVEN
jgi:hypothetical protein